MSGVYIKNIRMPENCLDCPCCDNEFYECKAKYHFILPKDEYGAVLGNRPEWCPLVEIKPQHGRLIDADKLLQQYGKMVFTAKTDYAEGLRDVIADIMNAPTVIPADYGEENNEEQRAE